MISRLWDYYKRNGIKQTILALWERVSSKNEPYQRRRIDEAELLWQKNTAFDEPLFFDIVVPAYHTDDKHFSDMITSVVNQTYGNFTLYIGDGGREERLKKIAEGFGDSRINYFFLESNGGISKNTNAILERVEGDYVVLLDHDDLLEPDALFCLMEVLDNRRKEGFPLFRAIFSDEDKCNSDASAYYEPNYKPNYDPDLLMSNNYICHLMCMERELIQKHRFRAEFDGAQDHDLFLRALFDAGSDSVYHLPKVLYHWRCHEGSTASNPASKVWAYEAGRHCVEDFCRSRGWNVVVSHSPYLGFYRVEYPDGVFNTREDVGAIVTPIYKNGLMDKGPLDEEGRPLYKGLRRGFAGYMKRGAMMQQVGAGDGECLTLRPELLEELPRQADCKGESYHPLQSGEQNCKGKLITPPLPRQAGQNPGSASKAESLGLCRLLRSKGYVILYMPQAKKV